jgi:uncharacterized HAD superfamily protein/hypoxanthine phosphoribosyltransferase
MSFSGPTHFVTLREAQEACGRLAASLPALPDLIVGIPRSGQIFASVLGASLNIPSQSLSEFVQGVIPFTGARGRNGDLSDAHVLVLDDSVTSGRAMDEARQTLAASGRAAKYTFAAVIATPEAASRVDRYGMIVPHPRVFEWHALHHHMAAEFCWDMDGVLCDDPPDFPDGDCPEYADFIRSAPPRLAPLGPLGWIVTSRLERYRSLTEDWLDRHGIRRRGVIMLDLPSARERRRLRIHAQFKASVYASLPSPLFIESDPAQARTIALLSRKAVYCSATFSFVPPGPWMRPRWRLTRPLPRRGLNFLLRKWVAFRCAVAR